MSIPYLPETTIRYTTGNLGLMDATETVDEGQLGRVLGPAPDGSGWIYTEPARYPGHVCPVDPSMIERA